MKKMKVVPAKKIQGIVEQLLFNANFQMPPGTVSLFQNMLNVETNELARTSMGILIENAEIAYSETLPLCQDCGMVIVFLEFGYRVTFESDVSQEIQNAVASVYEKNYLRKSIVRDPLRRTNTDTNTPAIIHTDITDGDECKVTVYLKGGGSENMTTLLMLKPTDTVDSIIGAIETAVIKAGPNPCPPLFLGIGIGGTADVAVLNSKKAVLRGIGSVHPDPFYQELELRIKERLNATNIGPLGFGGKNTIAEVYILPAPAHIASLPIALNMNCHSLRYWSATI